MADPEEREHSVMVAIFSVAAGMIGICLTGIGLLQVASSVRKTSTVADEFLAVNAVLFLGCCLTAFLSLRARTEKTRFRLRKVADGLLFFGLLLLVVNCALITSTFMG